MQPAIAELLRWSLQDVRFNDGGVATGFFVFDTTVLDGTAKDFDIKATGGQFPAFEYTPGKCSQNCTIAIRSEPRGEVGFVVPCPTQLG